MFDHHFFVVLIPVALKTKSRSNIANNCKRHAQYNNSAEVQFVQQTKHKI